MSQSDSMGSQVFGLMSPTVVKTRDDIIAEIMGEFETLLNSQISSMAASCRPTRHIPLFVRKDNSKKAENNAPNILLRHLQRNKIHGLQNHPQSMTNMLMSRFTSPSPDQIFTSQQQAQSSPHVVSNATNTIGNKLSASAGIAKASNKGKETFVGMKIIEHKAANIESMSESYKQILFKFVFNLFFFKGMVIHIFFELFII